MNSIDEDFFNKHICRTGILLILFQGIAVVKGEVSQKMNRPTQGSAESSE